MPLGCRELCFAFRRSLPVLGGLSASFEPGSVAAIVGPNGAGKTTLLRLLLGLLRPDSGEVTLDDSPVGSIPPVERALRLAFAAQRPSLAFGYTASAMAGFGVRAGDRRETRRLAAAALDAVGLGSLGARPVAQLSAGQQQRVSLARALAQLDSGRGDRYLLADEPTASLDPGSTLAVVDLLRERARRGLGVVVVLHDLAVAARAADRVLLLECDGRLAASGPPDETLTPHLLGRVYGARFETLRPGVGPPVPVPIGGGRPRSPGEAE